ncbi:PREDICTED: uncharacterized protein LOC108359891 [Rhagoletis zephyria]|uniref:uncharacterized protein LOC108359891 n=1 Tax=Rhagoletis zephyria TaxID=28612 RepID=UPI00081140B9|nr:PREDICTED: uncharacterized protein LOC108359891 [Rhagoletis zephyria]XP_036340433.1 uncharacterized protein LOC118749761 [Rhagoletis pomonella]
MLQSRRKKSSESFKEYLYTLMEIAKPIKLDEVSLIGYFVEGIPDSRANKIILYQSQTIKDLKENLKVYERVHDSRLSSNRSHYGQNTPKASTSQSSIEGPKKCYKCSSTSHLAKDCSNASKQYKCFKCGQVGHRSFECKGGSGKQIKTEKGTVNTMLNSPRNHASGLIFKWIQMENVVVDAMVDTGSVLGLINYNTFRKLNYPELSSEKRRLVGIKESELNTIGSITREINVDSVTVEVTFHVTKSNDLRYEAVLGNDILKKVDISFSEGTAEFKQKPQIVAGNKTDETHNLLLRDFTALCLENELVSINGDPPLKLSHLPSDKRDIVTAMVEKYTPVPNSKSPVEMQIIVSDDMPIY